ncbi:Phospholipase D3 [Trichinella pseudospiralis]|uniref:Phospholipase D3 n=1 Tax=Trichinella pseudospiralis TaxID=6337 RepID=A0A0V1FQP0_TRIPS|nr:Phospholipase D3 [Trichinella pseudospiralis]
MVRIRSWSASSKTSSTGTVWSLPISAYHQTRDGRPDLTNLEMDLFDVQLKKAANFEDRSSRCHKNCLKPSCLPITIIVIFIAMVIMFSLLNEDYIEDFVILKEEKQLCSQQNCRISLVESIPMGMQFAVNLSFVESTYDTWQELLTISENSVHIGAFYWSLRAKDMLADDSDAQGTDLFNLLEKVGRKRKISIAQNLGDEQSMRESELLDKQGLAEIRSLNFSKWFGSGVLHTKLWIIDEEHFYIGSANMDWRALTQVKELGVAVYNCSCLARDLDKIFQVYWYMGKPGTVLPKTWPAKFSTFFNSSSPMRINLNGIPSDVYFSSSPGAFCPRHREKDIDALIDVIDKAMDFVHVAVMDYLPIVEYVKYPWFWPRIDNAIRAAAFNRKVKVKLLISQWNHTKPSMFAFLNSLAAFGAGLAPDRILIKIFVVPTYSEKQAKIPYSRVNHNKYMITEDTAYIGTSNWVGDYFLNTAGAAIVIRQTNITGENSSDVSVVGQLQELFDRDWNSSFASDLKEFVL